MPDMHVATPNGQRFADDETRIHKMISDGEISAESIYWMKGMPTWRPVADLIAGERSDEPPPLPPNWPPAEPRKPISKLAVVALVCAGMVWVGVLILTFTDFRFVSELLLISVAAAIGALVFAGFAARRIKKCDGMLGGRKLIVISRSLVGLLFLWAVIIPSGFRHHPPGHGRTLHSSNIRQIGQASLIYANDNREMLPPSMIIENGCRRPTTIHDVARLLAQGGYLNDASLWFYHRDETLTKEAQTLHGPVLGPDREQLHPDFAKQNVFSVDYLTGLHMSSSSRTPIAWTRGLRPDGTWDSDGVFGTEGGHIVFIGGNVSFYRNLKGDDGSGVLLDTNGNPTANILDAMPPGTRIVGGGPGSLNGFFKPDNSAGPR